jgi:uncharacterized protein (DUF1810 family)
MTSANDPHNLQRFVDAQNAVFEQVFAELRKGQKQGHRMWFIFPWLRGLGNTEVAVHFAITSRDEAQMYLKHPALGPRIRECTRLVNLVEGRLINQIFGYPDDLKFRSSMTLFAAATSENKIFNALRACNPRHRPSRCSPNCFTVSVPVIRHRFPF